jgi:hypothetical protein
LDAQRYRGPFTITEDTVVRAVSVGLGSNPVLSEPVVARFTGIRIEPSTLAKVNFQSGSQPVAEGWLIDAGAPLASRQGIAYGWNMDVTDATRIRKKHSDPMFDTLVHFKPGSVWAIAVDNGTYAVTVSIGDAEFAVPAQTLYIEGQPLAKSVDTGAGEFAIVRGEVEVSDGQLTISSNDPADKSVATRMNWLTVRPVEE